MQLKTKSNAPFSASIKASTPIQTHLDMQRPTGRVMFPAGAKPPRKRATSMQWPQEFNEIKAPVLEFKNADGVNVEPIDANDGEKLIPRQGERGEIQFGRRVENEDGTFRLEMVSDVLFQAEDGSQWTEEHVQPFSAYDYLVYTGTPEDLQKLYNAVGRFSKATGKGLIVRQESETTDAAGNTLTQTKHVYRIR